MSRNIYEWCENQIRNSQHLIDQGEWVKLTLPKGSRWPEGTVPGSVEHTQVLAAFAKKHGAKFRNFSESKWGDVATFTWGHAKNTAVQTIHRKKEGLLLISDTGECRYATLLESLRYRVFGTVPKSVVH